MEMTPPPDNHSEPHQLQQVADDCWWVYVQSRTTGEFPNTWLKVLYIGQSREDALDWIDRNQR